jgi:glutathione synthase/RimK-type ligase-like ATP-grasp enzyme
VFEKTLVQEGHVKNSQRVMVKIIKEICAANDILCEGFSYDWILQLTKNDRTIHIYGYQFENNSATAQLICTDKCATSELLRSNNIPNVEHYFFITPSDMQYIGANGNWPKMLELLAKYGKMVCKPNDGTGGKEVYLVTNPAELEIAADRIFSLDHSIALSPYYEIDQEYRLILLDGKIKLAYSKNIPKITGDGKSTVSQLLLQYSQIHPEIQLECSETKETLAKVLISDEKMPLTWKHNLGQGALPEFITDKSLFENLGNLAKQAASAVNVQFASVDIIQTGGKYLVLEINSGIMMENFAETNASNYALAKNIYQEAILTLLNYK